MLFTTTARTTAQPTQFSTNGFETYNSIDVAGRQASAIAVADFNGDGFEDLAVSLKGQRTLKHVALGDHDEVVILLRNSTDSTVFDAPSSTVDSITRFLVGGTPEPTGGADPVALEVAALDSGSVSDVISANFTDKSVTVILNPGQSTAGTTQTYSTDPSRPQALAVADFDGAHGPDFAVACDDGKIFVFLNDTDSDGSVTLLASYSVGTNATALAVHDLNPSNDSFPDILVGSVHSSTGPNLYSLESTTTGGALTGFGVFSRAGLTNLPSAMVVADVLTEYSGSEILTSSNDAVIDALTILYEDSGVQEMLIDVNGSCSSVLAVR